MTTTVKLAEVVSALGDVIQSQQSAGQQHEPTPTEFFAIIFSSLSSGKHDESLVHQLNILNAVIPRSSKTIVSAQFKALSSCLLKIANANNEDERIVQACLEALGSAAQVQDVSDGFWGAVSSLQVLNAFLSCMDDSRYRIRKTASNILLSLIKKHKRVGSRAARSYIGDFCLGVLKACTRSEYKRSLCVIMFLETSAVYFPDTMLPQLIETSLRLEACGQPLLTAAVCRMIDALFQNTALSLSTEKTTQCIQLLLQMRPTTADMEANTYFCTALASGLIYLHKIDISKQSCRTLLVPSILALVSGCETDFTQIHCAVGSALKRVITTCLDFDDTKTTDTITSKGKNNVGSSSSSSSSYLRDAIAAIETLVQLKYQHSWLYVMDAVRSLFDRFKGDQAKEKLQSLIIKLADLYHAVHTTALQLEPGVEVALGDTLGMAIRSCGVANFLSVVPFREAATPAYVGVDRAREWLLSLLHANLKLMRCKLADFGGTILPIAGACSQAVQHPTKFGLDDNSLQMCRTRVLQLWSLLPDFLYNHPFDVIESFPRLAKILETAMKDNSNYPEIIPHIVVGLTHLAKGARERCPYQHTTITSSQNNDSNNGNITGNVAKQAAHVSVMAGTGQSQSQEITVLASHAATFVPAVLVYLEGATVGDSCYHTGVQFIGAWASICPPPLLVGISKKLLQLLLTSTGPVGGMNVTSANGSSNDNNDTASIWMAVIQAFIPYMPASMVTLLYRTVRPLLSVNESISLQKRAYYVLDALLKSHEAYLTTSSESRVQMLGLVSESLLTCQVSARSMRLRCMETILVHMSDEELSQATGSVLGEVLICQKDANKKTRDSATELLLMMIRRLPQQELLMQLCSAMAGETSVMRSAAVTGLCLLMLEHRTERDLLQAAADLVPTVCLLLRDQCSEETRAVLSYVRVCAAVLPAHTILPSVLPQIVSALSEEALGSNHKTKFSSRIRAILRKLYQRTDTETLRSLLSEPDQALLMYIERRARKAARKKDIHMVDANRIDKMLGSDSEDDDDAEDDVDSDDGSLGQGSTYTRDLTTKSGKSGGKSTVGKSIKSHAKKSVAAKSTTASMKGVERDWLGNPVASRHGSVMGQMIQVSALPKEDPRLIARPKATKAMDVVGDSNGLPSSLEDLLDDQPRSSATFATSVKKTAAVGKERSLGSSSSYKSGMASSSSSSSVPMAVSSQRPADEDEDYSVTVTSEGRVVVQQRDLDYPSADTHLVGDDGEGMRGGGGRKGMREEADQAAKAAAEVASRKRPRLKEPGEEYRSKKAGGDVWKRGMLEPHAYIPLDPRLLHKKNHKEAVAHFGVIVKSGKKIKTGKGAVAKGGRGKGGSNAGAEGNRKQRLAGRKNDE